MDLGLKGKRALVCGSSQGLGRAIAEALAAEGADVVINSRSAEKLAGARDAVADATGARVLAVPADLSAADGVDELIRGTRDALGTVDILVTNVGGPPAGPFEDHGLDAWRLAYAQLLESVVGLVAAFLPEMKERRWGRIVSVTSITVKQPVDGLILSNAMRAGVTGFVKSIANEAAPFGVTANTVIPGFTRTERLVGLAAAAVERTGQTVDEVYDGWRKDIPMGRLGEPEELAALTAFLCSEKAAYITGQSVAVDGGWIRGLL